MTCCKLFIFSLQSNSTFLSILDLLQFFKHCCCSILLECFIFFAYGGQEWYWWTFSLSPADSKEASLKLSSIFSVSFCINLFFFFQVEGLMMKENGSLYPNMFQSGAFQNWQKWVEILSCWSKLIAVLFLPIF